MHMKYFVYALCLIYSNKAVPKGSTFGTAVSVYLAEAVLNHTAGLVIRFLLTGIFGQMLFERSFLRH